MKTDYSLECEKCGLYNLQDGILEKGKFYCNECFEKIEEQRRKWRYNKKYKVEKFPITFKKKSGENVTFYGRKVRFRDKSR